MTKVLLSIAGAVVVSLFVVSFNFRADTQAKQPVTPKFWALVHVTDQLAVTRIAQASTYDAARKAGVNLGYEPIVEGSMAYFFPVPAWSEDQGKAVGDLLRQGLDGAFEKDINAQRLSQTQKKALSTFMHSYAGQRVGGDLGQMIRTSPLSSVKLRRTVDITFKSGSTEVKVPISGEWFESWKADKTGPPLKRPNNSSRTFPDRNELFGLGKKGFSVTLNKSTSYLSFDRVLDRAKELFKERQEENAKDLAQLTAQAREQMTNDEELKRVVAGGEASFRELSPAARAGLREFIAQSSESFPGLRGAALDRYLSDLTLSGAAGGFQVFLSFRVGKGTASNGTPVGYSVSWNINEVFERG